VFERQYQISETPPSFVHNRAALLYAQSRPASNVGMKIRDPSGNQACPDVRYVACIIEELNRLGNVRIVFTDRDDGDENEILDECSVCP
jgi:hypothetical protein